MIDNKWTIFEEHGIIPYWLRKKRVNGANKTAAYITQIMKQIKIRTVH